MKPFIFETSFDDRQKAQKQQPEEDLQMVEDLLKETAQQAIDHQQELAETYCEEDLKAAREEGVQEGITKGAADAANDYTLKLAGLSQQMAERLDSLKSEFDSALVGIEKDCVQMAWRMVKVLYPHIPDHYLHDELEPMLIQALQSGQPDQQLEIKTHVETSPFIEQVIKYTKTDITANIVTDNELLPGDVHITWPDGGMVRDQQALWDAIDTAVSQKIMIEEGESSDV